MWLNFWEVLDRDYQNDHDDDFSMNLSDWIEKVNDKHRMSRFTWFPSIISYLSHDMTRIQDYTGHKTNWDVHHIFHILGLIIMMVLTVVIMVLKLMMMLTLVEYLFLSSNYNPSIKSTSWFSHLSPRGFWLSHQLLFSWSSGWIFDDGAFPVDHHQQILWWCGKKMKGKQFLSLSFCPSSSSSRSSDLTINHEEESDGWSPLLLYSKKLRTKK